jgi:hypothetical protein
MARFPISIETGQAELLRWMVETDNDRGRGQFLAMGVDQTPARLLHHDSGARRSDVFEGDLEDLADRGFLRRARTSGRDPMYETTADGRKAYGALLARDGTPVDRVEREMRRLVAGGEFREQFPLAYERWAAAEQLLWGSDAEQQFTDIGHRCREATQLFATELFQVTKTEPPPVESTKVKVLVKAALGQPEGGSVNALVDSLIDYWGALVDVIQRQEHGAVKEGEALAWDDGRRVVFMTLVTMLEIARAAERTRPS